MVMRKADPSQELGKPQESIPQANTTVGSFSALAQHNDETHTFQQESEVSKLDSNYNGSEDSGSDWDAIDELSDTEEDNKKRQPAEHTAEFPEVDVRAQEQTEQALARDRSIPVQEDLPSSLRIGQPAALNIKRKPVNADSSVTTPASLSIANLSLAEQPTAPMAPLSETNPFRRPSDPTSKKADLESSATIWQDETGLSTDGPSRPPPPPPVQAPPPIPPSITIQAPTPSTSIVSAHGRMTSTSDSLMDTDQDEPAQIISEPPPMPPPDHNPWQGLDSLDNGVGEPRSSHGKKRESILDQKSLVDVGVEEMQDPTYGPDGSLHPAFRDKNSASPVAQALEAKAAGQHNEVYQIKHIRWYDAASETLRTSPILTQNANGPCPLLALVNALILSTPLDRTTSLVETMQSREQVSLGLLLDAVFDELVSHRSDTAAGPLPDLDELSTFLITLHTGMNVNPRFVPKDLDDAALPSICSFEDTREMRLYSAFHVPLIHGWLPPQDDVAFESFKRIAPTYEDAQNMQFHQEELENKLNNQSLNDDEQTLFIDLTFIRDFLTRWPTQLTAYGLETMKDSLESGSFAILFRNDHFSTIYKQPKTNRLMALVTDAGYSTHDEIVWETLVDINGANSEMCSGDFRSVSHKAPIKLPDDDAGGDWTTVQSKKGRRPEFAEVPEQQSGSAATTGMTNIASSSEQEDHDLALALQLQEEEDERQRQAVRRREEEQASQQYLSQEASRQGQGQGQGPPNIPPRRSGNYTAPPTSDPDAAPPPPRYEEAASGSPYHPPQGHPANEFAPRQSAYGQNAAAYGGPAAQLPSRGRRRLSARAPSQSNISGPPPTNPRPIQGRPTAVGEDRDDRCVLM